MRSRTALFITIGLLTVWYFLLPVMIPPVNLLVFSIENPRPSQDGLWVNFTVVIKNRGIWPLVLSDLRWGAGPLFKEYRVAGFPASMNLLPFQTIRIEAFVTYTLESFFWIGFRQGIGQPIDARIRRVVIYVEGKVSTFGAPGLTSLLDTYVTAEVSY